MARALDEFVVASKLHVDEVVAFVREIDRPSRIASLRPVAAPAAIARKVRARRAVARVRRIEPAREADAATLRERRLVLRAKNTARAIGSAPRAALLLGVALIVLGLGTALGLRGRNQARAMRESEARPRRRRSRRGPPVGGAGRPKRRPRRGWPAQFRASAEQVPPDRIWS